MMQTNDKWTEQFRKRMNGHTEPLPEGLWEQLERELPATPSANVLPLWKRWAFAAAAAVAVAILSTSLVHFWQASEVEEIARQSAPVTGSLSPQTAPSAEVQASSTDNPPLPSSYSAQSSYRKVSHRFGQDQQQTQEPDWSVPHNDLMAEVPGTPDEQQEEVTTTASVNEPKRTSREQRTYDRQRMKENEQQLRSLPAQHHRKWSIGIGAGNTMASTSIAMNGLSTLELPGQDNIQSAPSETRTDNLLGNVISSYERNNTTHIHHKMPVTMGVSIAWPLNHHWTLESGLYYTLLSSDLTSNNWSAVREEQRLHYLGIPLKLQRTFWDSRWLTVYASVGGMVEKCISAQLKTTHGEVSSNYAGLSAGPTSPERTTKEPIRQKPWQLSGVAAAGLQLNVVPTVGIYAEPGVAYYFDDGSELQTIRKEHPCNFHLQVGLRVLLHR